MELASGIALLMCIVIWIIFQAFIGWRGGGASAGFEIGDGDGGSGGDGGGGGD